MKKALLFIGLCVLTLSASAQFKIQSSGNYYVTCDPGEMNGMSLSKQGDHSDNIYGGYFNVSSGATCVGFRSHAEIGNTCVGVMGSSGSATKTLGLVGSISNTGSGAGVYGTTHNDMGSAIPANTSYAGFFYGNVKVTGSMLATCTI